MSWFSTSDLNCRYKFSQYSSFHSSTSIKSTGYHITSHARHENGWSITWFSKIKMQPSVKKIPDPFWHPCVPVWFVHDTYPIQSHFMTSTSIVCSNWGISSDVDVDVILCGAHLVAVNPFEFSVNLATNEFIYSDKDLSLVTEMWFYSSDAIYLKAISNSFRHSN